MLRNIDGMHVLAGGNARIGHRLGYYVSTDLTMIDAWLLDDCKCCALTPR